MKRTLVLSAALTAACLAGLQAAALVRRARPARAAPAGPVVLNADELHWEDAPAFLPKGTKLAVLEGRLGAEGPLTVRIRIAADQKVGPHLAEQEQRITVLSGVVLAGLGKKYDEDKGKQLTSDAYFTVPAGRPSFLGIRSDAELQIATRGPFAFRYLRASDDPRENKP